MWLIAGGGRHGSTYDPPVPGRLHFSWGPDGSARVRIALEAKGTGLLKHDVPWGPFLSGLVEEYVLVRWSTNSDGLMVVSFFSEPAKATGKVTKYSELPLLRLFIDAASGVLDHTEVQSADVLEMVRQGSVSKERCWLPGLGYSLNSILEYGLPSAEADLAEYAIDNIKMSAKSTWGLLAQVWLRSPVFPGESRMVESEGVERWPMGPGLVECLSRNRGRWGDSVRLRKSRSHCEDGVESYSVVEAVVEVCGLRPSLVEERHTMSLKQGSHGEKAESIIFEYTRTFEIEWL